MRRSCQKQFSRPAARTPPYFHPGFVPDGGCAANVCSVSPRAAESAAEVSAGSAKTRDLLPNSIFLLRPVDARNLRLGVHRLHARPVCSVPETKLTVRSTTASDSRLPEEDTTPWPQRRRCGVRAGTWRPLFGLRLFVPNARQVFAAAGRKLGAVGAPLEAAHFLRARSESGVMRIGDAHVAVVDSCVARHCRERRSLPRLCADTGARLVHDRSWVILLASHVWTARLWRPTAKYSPLPDHDTEVM